jgi:hypothetical protein
MLNCQNLDFSPSLAAERMKAAKVALGERGLTTVLAFGLFTLGARRSKIAQILAIPPGTLRTVNRRILARGMDGFFDARCKSEVSVPASSTCGSAMIQEPVKLSDEGILTIGGHQLLIQNPVQRRVVLLSLLHRELLTVTDVASALQLSPSRVRTLDAELQSGDVNAIVDKRRGQTTDYLVDVETKGQLIEEFVLELTESGKASSKDLAIRMSQTYGKDLAERTVRYHLAGMGLSHTKASLAAKLAMLKKKR